MKKLFLTLAILAPVLLMAQSPPVLRTPFTTNTPNANQFSGNAFKNLGRLTNADIYGFLMQSGNTGSFFPGSTLAVAGIIQLPFASALAVTDSTGSVTNGFAREGLEYTAATKSLTVSKTITDNLAGTNAAALTNLFIGVTNKFTLVSLTNSATSTNFVGLASGEFHNATVVYDPQLINRTNVYPVLNQYGQRWVTNVNAPLFTTLTNGNFYVLSLTTVGTNVFASMSVWSKN